MEEAKMHAGDASRIKPRAGTRLASGALLVTALIFVLPFLHPHHQAPIVTFYQEWLAALLCVFAAGLVILATGRQALPLPGLAWVPLVLATLVALQTLVGRMTSLQHATLYVGYLMSAVVSLALGRWLGWNFGLDRCVKAFASACLAGGLATAFLAVLQLHGIGVEYGLVSPDLGRITANLVQANQLTAYLWIGAISATYLGLRRTIRPAIATAALSVILFITFLPGSRSSIVFAIVLGALIEFAVRRGAVAKRDRRYSSWVLAGYLVAFFFVPGWLREAGLYSGFTLAERTAEELSSSSQRLWIWWLGWQGFLSAPAFGMGAGSIPWFAYSIAPWGPPGYNEYIPENAHNLFLQLAADLGVIAPLVVAVGLAGWVFGLRKEKLSHSHVWLLGFLGVLFVYSNLEYPLWFAYFLVPAMLLLGLGDRSATSKSHFHLASATPVITLALASGLAAMYVHYVRLERIVLHVQFQEVSEYRISLDDDARATLDDVPAWSPLSHYAEFTEIMTAPVKRSTEPETVMSRCNKVLRMGPGYLSTKKCTLLYALNGDMEKARYHLRQTAAAYPGRQKDLVGALRELAEQEPTLLPLFRDFERGLAIRPESDMLRAVN